MGTGISSVRDVAQPSKGSDKGMLPPSPPLSCRLPSPLPLSLLLIYGATSKGSAGAVDTPPRSPSRLLRGRRGSSSVEMGVVVHGDGGSSSVEMGGRRPWTSGVALRGRRGGSPKAGNGVRQPHSFRIARPFQQNGVAVPARRHRRSGETGATPPRGRAELSGKSPRPKIHRPARGGKTAAQYDAELGLKHPTL